MAKKCPSGFICTSGTSMALMCITIFILGVFAVILMLRGSTCQRQQQPIVIQTVPTTTAQTTVVSDLRYSRAPKPLKKWIYDQESGSGGNLMGLHTRGTPEQYRSIGTITVAGGDKQEVLPLYGRRTYGGRSSDRWNYYTRTDTYNPVQISVKYKNKDCVDEIGCNELYSGENIAINGINKNGTVEIYPNDSLRYSE